MRRLAAKTGPTSPPLQTLKLDLLDETFSRFGFRSFADLGGVWAVAAGYTFHLLDQFPIDRAVLVDSGITEAVSTRAAKHPQLELLHGMFGDPAVIDQVGTVDAVVLFDVLLHQVDPDWDQILERYAAHTSAFIVVQPQYLPGTETVRLLDLGEADYLANVPPEQIAIDFEHLDAIHPKYERPVRDIHEIWQWGITDADLTAIMRRLGFRLVSQQNAGRWRQLDNFDNVGFVFVRDDLWATARG